jgi:hypothetical protein
MIERLLQHPTFRRSALPLNNLAFRNKIPVPELYIIKEDID